MARTRPRRNRKSPPKGGAESKKLNTIFEESPASNLTGSNRPRRNRNARLSDLLHDPRSDVSEEADDESEGYGESEQEEDDFADSVEEKKEGHSQAPGLGQLSKAMAASFASSKRKQAMAPDAGMSQNQKW